MIEQWSIVFPARSHGDERRLGVFDVFPDDVVEINIVIIAPNQSAGDWHSHVLQTDYWFVASGELAVGLKYEGELHIVTMDDETHFGDVLKIPPGWLHTYKASSEGAILVYGLTNKSNGTDEGRTPFSKTDAEIFG